MRQTKKIPKTPLAIACLSLIATAAIAQEQIKEPPRPEEAKTLQQTNIYGTRQTLQKAAREEKKQEDIARELITDSHDLVRYTTDASISDGGRHNKGFAMRGVESNRVGIAIDGVSMPDLETNSLYGRYGNFNSARQTIDTELISQVEIAKGSDSFAFGSGALGGAVNYKTLESRDFIQKGKTFGAIYKTGYAGKNRQWTNTIGLGSQWQNFDLALLFSKKHGHETKTGVPPQIYEGSDKAWGGARGTPDPSQTDSRAWLAKIGYIPNDENRIALSLTGQKAKRFTNEYSYALLPSQWRNANDTQNRVNTNLHYEYMPSSTYLSLLRIDLDLLKTDLDALNYKGSKNWKTDEPELNELYDRRLASNYKRLMLQAKSKPLDAGKLGSHEIAITAATSQRKFSNINYDTLYLSSGPYIDTYTIQYPVKNKQYSLSIQDDIQLNQTFSAKIGIRYDKDKIGTEELNAKCSTACMAEGRPKGGKFTNTNALIDLAAKINPAWQAGIGSATGHRVPTASEMYFTFTNAYGTWQSNPNLKAEKSLTHNIWLKGKSDWGELKLNLYQSNYKNFLNEQENIIKSPNPYWPDCEYYGCKEFDQTPRYQMVNLDKAKIRGLELNTTINTNQLIPSAPKGLKLSAAIGLAKGSLSNKTSLLSIQPAKTILGIDYEAPSGNWGIFARMTHTRGKKAKDAQVFAIEGSRGNLEKNIVTYPWLSPSASVFDLFGYYKPNKNLTLRLGIYNLGGKKYYTWDSLRGINAVSTTNTLDRNGRGISRFSAPGRNIAISAQYKF